jgi:hypothetical protein
VVVVVVVIGWSAVAVLVVVAVTSGANRAEFVGAQVRLAVGDPGLPLAVNAYVPPA